MTNFEYRLHSTMFAYLHVAQLPLYFLQFNIYIANIYIKMNILPVPFAILTYFGIWMPTEWATCKWKKFLYNVLTIFVLFFMYTFVGSELVEVIIYLFKYKGISETLYVLLTTSSVCFKAVTFLIRKRDLVYLGDMLLDDHCIPRNDKEKEIQQRFDNINRYVTGTCMLLVYSNILMMVTIPLFRESNAQSLPYKTWLPYSIKNPYSYWLSYVHQTVGLFCCGSVSLANDNIVTGFMLQACAQFDILEHRFKTLPGLVHNIRTQMSYRKANQFEKIMLTRHLQHHNYLYIYVKNIMSTFGSVIMAQFCASAMVITISVYQLSKTSPTNFDFINILLYLISMLVEFFMYCWFGNEVNLKSIIFAENVYKTNWTILSLQSWKMVLFLIHRSSKPIVLSCYNMVVLSLDTYVQILKFSYSTFNILRQSAAD